MKKNMGAADRIIRTILAIVVAILYFTDHPWGSRDHILVDQLRRILSALCTV